MPLFGSLKSMPLPDLLQWLGTARMTGTLQVEHAKVSKSILLKDGQIVGCSSDDPPQRLGHFLLARGKITEDQLREALARQEQVGRHLGALLVEMGAIDGTELTRHLEAKAEETIFSLFDWTDAVFRFQEDAPDQAHLFPVSLRVEDVLLRGLQRYDEMQQIREVFRDNGIVLRHTDTLPPPDVLSNRMARTLYDAVDGERSVAEILLHVHGSEFIVLKFLYELHRNGLVEVVGIKRREPESPAPPVALGDDVGIDAPERDEPTPSEPAARAAGGGDSEEDLEDLLAGWNPESGGSHGPVSSSQPSGARGTAVAVAAADDDEQAAEASPREELDRILEETRELVPLEQSDGHQLETRLATARERMAAGEFEPALDILDTLYREFPGDESLRRLTAEAEAAFVEKAYKHYVPPSKVPELTRPVSSLESENLSPTEFFLLSRIDGAWDVKSIIQIAPMREADALRTLKRMRESGMITLRDPQEN